MNEPAPHGATSSAASDAELLAILSELGREVTAVLDLDQLLERIPNLISRLTSFTVFSVYLLDEHREELSIAYALGYPEEIVKHFTLKLGQGTVGTAVAEQRPVLLNDVSTDPRYLAVVPGARSQLAVPLRQKGRIVGCIYVDHRLRGGAFDDAGAGLALELADIAAVAIENARLTTDLRQRQGEIDALNARLAAELADRDAELTRVRSSLTGRDVLCLYNQAFEPYGVNPATGTAAPDVQRPAQGASKP